MTSADTPDGPGPKAALPDLVRAGAFVAAAGFEPTEATGTRVAGHVDVGPDHHTPWGVVHGGLYTLVVESAASIGASAAVLDRGQFAVGLNNSTDFLRSTTDGRLDVVAEPVIQGRTQQLWRVTLTREDGKAAAQGTVRLQNVDLPG
ncbi:MAG TPA: PaaI family thioesterase [Acidimicrobiales bacterium]|nr:PaaI family thioesterase [Acidimicrobiales bacterium]